ncbi:hypothetical protein ACQKDS_19805 [Serratia sp. NPDC078593]|uniref:hypothetical protein n=1 Tax=unclassified Serratia (in: enterobacteria) TaxID=2647522 RepID=UPI0037CFEADA
MAITLARRFAKLALFIFLVWGLAHIIDPARFISLETTQDFARWKDGSVNQENFDDLCVLLWVIGTFFFAWLTYTVIMFLIRKMRCI